MGDNPEINGYHIFKPAREKNWYYWFIGEDGKRKQRSTQKSAMADAKRYVRALPALATGTPTHLITFGEFLEPYFDWDRCPRIQRMLVDKKTIGRNYVGQIRRYFLTHILGDESKGVRPDIITRIPLLAIGASDFESLKSRLSKKKVPDSVINYVIGGIKSAIADGMHRDLIRADPISRVSKIKRDADEIGIFSPEEFRELFTNREYWIPSVNPNAHGNSAGKFTGLISYGYFRMLASTGMRAAEVSAAYLDQLHGDVFTVDHAFKIGEGRGLPKWNKIREIPLENGMVELLKEIQDTRQAEREEMKPDDKNYPEKTPYLFSYNNGNPLMSTWRQGAIERAIERYDAKPEHKIKIGDRPNITTKSIRHTFNTMLIEAGCDNRKIKAYMGWERSIRLVSELSLSKVQDGYTHLGAEKLRDLIPIIQSFF